MYSLQTCEDITVLVIFDLFIQEFLQETMSSQRWIRKLKEGKKRLLYDLDSTGEVISTFFSDH